MLFRNIKKSYKLVKEKNVKAFLNFLALGFSSRFQLLHVYGKPTFAHIEITTRCDGRCIMCGKTLEAKNNIAKSEYMHLEDFKKIIFKLPYLEYVFLHGLGEPLFHPDISEMIKFCKERKIKVIIITNASLLSEKVGRKLISAGIYRILFSIDGAKEKTFKKIRAGLNFSAIIENIKGFIKLKDELKPDLGVKITTTVLKDNIREIPDILNLSKSLSIKGINLVQSCTKYSKNSSLNKDEMIKHATLLQKCKSYGKSIGLNVRIYSPDLASSDRHKRCWFIWKSIFIDVDGWIPPCTFLPHKTQLNYGNILRQEFKDIWNNKLYQYTRKLLRSNMPDYPCKECIWSNCALT